MALFYGQECPLCGVEMTNDDRRFATSHFLDSGNDLWRFSDAVMHWDCYATWEHRVRFARMYFEANCDWSVQNPSWGVAYSDDQLLVTVNPDKLVSKVSVMLAETGSKFRIDLGLWEDWLGGKWFEGCQHEIERETLSPLLPLLRSILPTAESVIAAASLEDRNESPTNAAGGMVAHVLHEFACQSLAERAASKGVTCPGCGTFSTDYEYFQIDKVSESGPQSYLLCRACGIEFGPMEV